MLFSMQPGTKENRQRVITMGQIQGPVLKALISFMYGCLECVPANLALQLFVAADAHQASFRVGMQVSDKVVPVAVKSLTACRWSLFAGLVCNN